VCWMHGHRVHADAFEHDSQWPTNLKLHSLRSTNAGACYEFCFLSLCRRTFSIFQGKVKFRVGPSSEQLLYCETPAKNRSWAWPANQSWHGVRFGGFSKERACSDTYTDVFGIKSAMKQSSISKYFQSSFARSAKTKTRSSDTAAKSNARSQPLPKKRSLPSTASRSWGFSGGPKKPKKPATKHSNSTEIIDVTDLTDDHQTAESSASISNSTPSKTMSKAPSSTARIDAPADSDAASASEDAAEIPPGERPSDGAADTNSSQVLQDFQYSKSRSKERTPQRNANNKVLHYKLQQLVFERLRGSSTAHSTSGRTTNKEVKWTPLEIQVRDLKKKHPDLFLFVEVGYRYRFFGKDAEIASRLLDIYAHQDRHYLVASIPTHRLSVHVARVVNAGYKVGVVRQTETAAIKKASKVKGSSAKCFTRSVTNIYTTGTLLPGEQFGEDPDLGDSDSSASAGAGSTLESPSKSNVVLTICEASPQTSDAKSKVTATADGNDSVTIGLCSIDLATGAIVHDQFTDDFLRGGLVTRLAHLCPVEVLLPSAGGSLQSTNNRRTDPALSSATETVVAMLQERGILGERARIERIPEPPFDQAGAVKLMSSSLQEVNDATSDPPSDATAAVQAAKSLASTVPLTTLRALAGLVSYLKTFGMEKSFAARLSNSLAAGENLETSGFLVPFSSVTTMHLDGHTLVNLDVISARQRQDRFQSAHAARGSSSTTSSAQSKSRRSTAPTSLLQMLDQTYTRGGKERLRQWLLRPLTSRVKIEERLDAVEEIAFGLRKLPPSDASPTGTPGTPACLDRLLDILRTRKCPSLGLYVARLDQSKLTPVQFCEMLGAFRLVLSALPDPSVAAEQLQSTILRKLLIGNSFQQFSTIVAAELAKIHPSIAQRVAGGRGASSASTAKSKRLALTETQNVFVSVAEFPHLARLHEEVHEVESMLRQHLLEIRKVLGIPDLEFKTLCTGYSSQLEFLIELKRSNRAVMDKVPANWTRVSSTKQVERFHTPTVTGAVEALELAREKIQIHTRLAWSQHLQKFSSEYRQTLAEISALVDFVDALQSLAQVASMPNYCRPRFIESTSPSLRIVNGRHPIVEVFNSSSTAAFVPNSISLGQDQLSSESTNDETSCILLTGPNMGGKSCLVRMVGLAVLMAQSGCFVAADEMTSTVVDCIFTRMGSSDSILSGMSTFLVEMSQTAQIISRATNRSLVILDELGRGTSNEDGEAIAYATLRHCVERIGCLTVFITHYPNLSACSSAYRSPALNKNCPDWHSSRVRNMHMAYIQASAGHLDECVDGEEDTTDSTSVATSSQQLDLERIEALIRPVTFLYRITEGPSPMSFGINVARMAGIPKSVLLEAARLSSKISARQET